MIKAIIWYFIFGFIVASMFAKLWYIKNSMTDADFGMFIIVWIFWPIVLLFTLSIWLICWWLEKLGGKND